VDDLIAVMAIEIWPITRLVPFARNPRKNDHAIDRMVNTIKGHGFRVPIMALSDGSIIDGHLRLKAAQRMGMTKVPVSLADDMTDEQIQTFRLAINRSATWAEWDADLLPLLIRDAADSGCNLGLTGFDPSELESMMEGDGDAMFTLQAAAQHAVAFNVTFCDANGKCKDRPNGGLYVNEADQAKTVTSGGDLSTYVAFAQNCRDEMRLLNGDGDLAGALSAEPGMKQQTFVAGCFKPGQSAASRASVMKRTSRPRSKAAAEATTSPPCCRHLPQPWANSRPSSTASTRASISWI